MKYKNSKKILVAVILVMFISLWGAANILASRILPDNADELNAIAQNVASSTQELFKQDNNITAYTLETAKPYIAKDKAAAVANIMGDLISREYFNQRINLYKAFGSDNPIVDAWNATKKEVAEFHFAEEHNLLPNTDEILERTKQECELYDTDLETKKMAQYLIEQIGLTWEEYWTSYKPMYEMPSQLIKENIYYYLQENNLPELDYTDIEYEIFDQEIINGIMNEEN